jgi:hypothetical protein
MVFGGCFARRYYVGIASVLRRCAFVAGQRVALVGATDGVFVNY